MKKSICILAIVAATAAVGCKGGAAGQPTLDPIEQTILQDVESGFALDVIEQAVASLFPGIASDAAALDVLVKEVIVFLEQENLIPTVTSRAYAAVIKSQVDAKLFAVKKGGWAPSPTLKKIVTAMHGDLSHDLI